jgi:hypothetical protein
MIKHIIQRLKLSALIYTVFMLLASSVHAGVVSADTTFPSSSETVFSPSFSQSESTDEDGTEKDEEEEPDCD